MAGEIRELEIAPVRKLLQAARFADALNLDPWQFAIGLDPLKQLGLSENELRWMLFSGYLSQRFQIAPSVQVEGRNLLIDGYLPLLAYSCFVLTDIGRAFAETLLESRRILSPDYPVWKHTARELVFRGAVVKRLIGTARNQELILEAFEEEGWPERIDDPLPPVEGVDSKQRLHDAIKRLNRAQQSHLICFRGDGRAVGVRWQALI